MVSKTGIGLSKTVKREMALMPKSREVAGVYKKMMLDAERSERSFKNKRYSESSSDKDNKANGLQD